MNQILKRQMDLNDAIDKKLAFSNYKNYNLSLRNRLRSIINVIRASSRMINVKFNNSSLYRHELLKTFASYYETISPTIEKWVFASIRTTYLSIYNFDELDMKLKSLSNRKDKDHAYIAIETRVKGMIDGLKSKSTIETIELNILKFLSIICTNGNYIPLKFYYKFELCRMKTEN